MIRTSDIVRETGITERKLNYWIDHGIIPVINGEHPGSGRPRRYEENIIPKVQLLVDISNLFRNGLDNHILKKAYDNFEQGTVHLGNDIFLSW